MFSGLLKWLLDTFKSWLTRQGAQEQVAADTAKEIADVQTADNARAAVDRDVAVDPSGLRADDGFERRD